MPGALPSLVLGLPELCQSGLGQRHLPWCQSQPGSHRCGAATSTSSESTVCTDPGLGPSSPPLWFSESAFAVGLGCRDVLSSSAALLPHPGGHLP